MGLSPQLLLSILWIRCIEMVITSIVGAGLRLASRLAQAEYNVYRRVGYKPRYARGLTVTTGIGTVIGNQATLNDNAIPQKSPSRKQFKTRSRFKRYSRSGYSTKHNRYGRSSKRSSYRSRSNYHRCSCKQHVPKSRSRFY